jgi:hypothetical protein
MGEQLPAPAPVGAGEGELPPTEGELPTALPEAEPAPLARPDGSIAGPLPVAGARPGYAPVSGEPAVELAPVTEFYRPKDGSAAGAAALPTALAAALGGAALLLLA